MKKLSIQSDIITSGFVLEDYGVIDIKDLKKGY
jgi:hypothetical protein